MEAVRGCSKEYTVSDVTDIQFRLEVDVLIISYRDERGAYKQTRARVNDRLLSQLADLLSTRLSRLGTPEPGHHGSGDPEGPPAN